MMSFSSWAGLWVATRAQKCKEEPAFESLMVENAVADFKKGTADAGRGWTVPV